MGAAAEQRNLQELEQGVYVVINPYTGNAISEVLYAAWDKTMAPVFGISNASEMRNELVMQAGAQGYVVNEVNASRGNITSFNGQQHLDREGITNAPISQVLMNGSPINAQDMQGVMDRTTGGKAQVYQSTHQNDWVSTGIGNNPQTGGQPSSFIDAHTGYGPNTPDKQSGGQASKANQCLHGCNHEETNTIAGMLRAIVNNILLFAQNGLAFCTDVGYLAETWIHQK